MRAEDFDPDEFLRDALERAGTAAQLGRILGLASSRIAEFFRPPGQKKRTLTMKEGVKIAEALKMWPCEPVSAEQLKAILEVCLRHPPQNGWSDRAVERLAQDIVDGLELLRSLNTSSPSQDALDVVARGIADRLRGMPS